MNESKSRLLRHLLILVFGFALGFGVASQMWEIENDKLQAVVWECINSINQATLDRMGVP